MTIYRVSISRILLFAVWILSLWTINLFPQPRAGKGIIDLSQYDFARDGSCTLDGEWEIYIGKHYTPSDFDTIDKTGKYSYTLLPANLNGTNINGQVTPAQGFGTYRLRIILPHSAISRTNAIASLGLYIIEIHSAYNLWIDTSLVLRQGVASPDSKQFKPEIRPGRVFFSSNKDTVQLIINFSNYFDSKMFGADDHFYIGIEKDLIALVNRKQFFYLFAFGVLIIIGLYHFILHFSRPDEKFNLSFSITTFLLAVQTLVEGERVIYYIIPDISTELVYKVWLLTINMTVTLLLFFRHLYPEETNKTVLRYLAAIFAAFSISVIFVPYSFNSKLMDYIFLTSFTGVLYIFYISVLAAKRKREYAVLVLIGLSVPLITAINDLLFGLDWIVTGYYMPIGFLFFTVFQSIIISLKNAKMFRDIQILRDELQESNNLLEERVEARTEEVRVANIELKKLNTAKDGLFSIIAHDLKNPFHVFLGYTDILKMPNNGLSNKDSLDIAVALHETAQSGYKLLENLLDWSRLQLGISKADPDELSIADVCKSAISLYSAQALMKNITLHLDIKSDSIVYADERMMSTVARNLIANAIKFSHQNSVINITIEKDNNFVILKVSDTGIGMDESLRAKLYKVDERVSRKGTSGEMGTGLGLVLVKEFIEIHRGRLEVESEVGKGSIFKIYIPVSKSTIM